MSTAPGDRHASGAERTAAARAIREGADGAQQTIALPVAPAALTRHRRAAWLLLTPVVVATAGAWAKEGPARAMWPVTFSPAYARLTGAWRTLLDMPDDAIRRLESIRHRQ